MNDGRAMAIASVSLVRSKGRPVLPLTEVEEEVHGDRKNPSSSKYAPTFLLNTASMFMEKRAAKLADE